MEYQEFIRSKEFRIIESGFEANEDQLPDMMFDYQISVTKWALQRGRAAAFLDTGLGKTIVQTAWAEQVSLHTGKPVLILAPLAVSDQTIDEAKSYGIIIQKYHSNIDPLQPGVFITNYEQLHNVDCSIFSGVALDESSILKGMQGKYRKLITESFRDTPYKLSCTATPSPNDFMELGTQAEFLGIMSQVEMLAMFFIHDGGDTSKWRLKGHGQRKFWEWMATWAICMRSPYDLGFDGSKHKLPPVQYHDHVIETTPTDELFVTPAQGLLERNKARRDSVEERCKIAAKIANNSEGPFLVWCHLNDEGDLLEKLIPDSVQVSGSQSNDVKTDRLHGFSCGKYRVLISKPKLSGFGMNWQHCNQMVFVGLSDSWESYYQAIRRCWRFGQKRDVNVHVVSADTEGAVVENIKRKDQQNSEMSKNMVEHMRELTKSIISSAATNKTEYTADKEMILPVWLRSI